jgi:hypothetical protein
MSTHIAEDKIDAKFSKLILEGRNILSNCGFDGREYRHRFPPTADYTRFRTEGMNLFTGCAASRVATIELSKGLQSQNKPRITLTISPIALEL